MATALVIEPLAVVTVTAGSSPGQKAQMTTSEAMETLRRAAETTARAEQARIDVKKAMSTMKEVEATVEATVATANRAVEFKSSFDKQWEEFKAKFDKMNSMALERIGGMMGVAPAGLRPAEFITEARVAQVLRRAKNVVVLTGAGVSAESGIPTFRGSDGYWTVGSENYRPQELATWEKFNEMPEELWRWYQYRWGICTKANPNPGHYALAELESLINGDITLVTQNIDGLHLRAGSDPARVCEIHGRIDEMRCDERTAGACLHGVDLNDPNNRKKALATVMKTPKPAAKESDERLPLCRKCGVRQRPKILWFDESYNEAFYKYETVKRKTEECDVLLIVGTQLCTGGPMQMVQKARASGCIIIRIDPLVDLKDQMSAGMLHLQGKSGDALPRIVAELKELRKEPLLAPLAPMYIASRPPTPPNTTCSPSKPSTPLRAANPYASKPSTPPLVANLPGALPKLVDASRRNSSASMAPRSSSTPAAARRSVNGGGMNASSAKGTFAAAASISLASDKARRAAPKATLRAKPGSPATADRFAKARSVSPFIAEGSAVGFFVYGTLRPDDDSGAAWTKEFQGGFDNEPALLPGASLYVDGSYPAVCLEQTRCSVRGVLLTPSGKDKQQLLAMKLIEADRIEGYPDLYQRTVVAVETASGQLQNAYVYHRTGRTDREACERVADGDWMSRKRAGANYGSSIAAL